MRSAPGTNRARKHVKVDEETFREVFKEVFVRCPWANASEDAPL